MRHGLILRLILPFPLWIWAQTQQPACSAPEATQMVFENITADHFDWNWQRSNNNGETWTDVWNIHYTRKK